MRIDLTDEERGALVCAMTVMITPMSQSFLVPLPDETPHQKRIRIIAYSAFLKLIGHHPDQIAIAGNYQI